MRLLLVALVFVFTVLAACDETEGSGVEDTTLSPLSSTAEKMATVEASTTAEATATTEISSTTAATTTTTEKTMTTEQPTTTEEPTSATTEQTETTADIQLDQSSSTREMEIRSTTEMATTTTKDPLRKWNHVDLNDPFVSQEKGCPEEKEIQMDEPVTPCPVGWLRYKESCYLIKKKLATMEMADKLCQNYDTTLFVADNQEEFEVISKAAVPGRTWLGMFQKDELKTTWQAGCGMDTEELPWLVKEHEYHGWNADSRCAFMFTSINLTYTHFQPCNKKHMNFICERNATLYLKD